MSVERTEQRNSRTRVFKAAIIGGTALTVLLLVFFFRGTLFWLPVGNNLQRHAWNASFTERGLSAPPEGIREGWNDRRIKEHRVSHFAAMMDGYRRHPQTGWVESEVHVPGFLATDGLGRQSVEMPGADLRLLILGGSVAFGAASSSFDTTYFSQLAQRLADRSQSLKITVGATGGWVSSQEVAALEYRDLELQPDVVLFLNGLNDIALARSKKEIVPKYLGNMKRAQSLGKKHNFRVVYALQPSLADKQHKSLIERHILELYWDQSPPNVRRWYEEMRQGLTELAQAENADFIDCSRLFDDESETTFCDFWHFSDVGHQLLATHLAERLGPILAELEQSRPVQDE